MSPTGFDTFDTTVQETNHWLKIMMSELGTDDRRAAFNALRAALHALRDRVGLENAVHLGAQLPMLRRGCTMRAGIQRTHRHANATLPPSSITWPRSFRAAPASTLARPRVPALP